jgi:hypothetical protein
VVALVVLDCPLVRPTEHYCLPIRRQQMMVRLLDLVAQLVPPSLRFRHHLEPARSNHLVAAAFLVPRTLDWTLNY